MRASASLQRLGLVVERAREWLIPPRFSHDFFIVTAAYNAADFIDRHLASIAGQRYDWARIHHLVIDDASTDATADRVARWARAHPAHRLELVRNPENRGGCANLTAGFRRAPPDSIVLQVDGDDWLPDPGVIAYLNRLYADPELWMTYNTWALPDGTPSSTCIAIPEAFVAAGDFRERPWMSSHLHSFRAKLFAHVRDEDLHDPATGQPWRSSVDLSHYLPMLELARHHARHVPRVTYVYNLHEQSLFVSRREEQIACEQRIRALPRYAALERL